MDKEAIEPILLKHIIEHQKKYLRSGLTPDQRKVNAKWYLVNSTASYRGLIAGINELLESYSSELRKENEELKDTSAHQSRSLLNFHDKITQLQSTIEATQKELAESKKEIERLKGLLKNLVDGIWGTDPFREGDTKEEYWQQFKSENNL